MRLLRRKLLAMTIKTSMQAYDVSTKCHAEPAAKQGEPENRSFIPLPGVSASIPFRIIAFSCYSDRSRIKFRMTLHVKYNY
ncbi:MAG TPA: hypothetical protein DDW90_08565 [Cyanobacteria bacterium UBA9971]|nr:hypothetical protein [Cyanobacteria bacterium UBA9971]